MFSLVDEIRKLRLRKFVGAKLPMISFDQCELSRVASRLDLPISDEAPVISILIPVYNQAKLTLECLAALKENTDLSNCEIVIADDASTDQTQSLLPLIKGIRYFRNSTNLNFVRSCNQAVRHTRGKYLVILNNDTQVQKDWLPPLLECLRVDPSVGIVGPKFLFPDGSLQEAGALVRQDASVDLLGCFDDPSLPRYNYLRAADHVSGACIMLEKSLFEKVGGFSDEFAPCYYEDLDLSFKVRALDKRVVYQPKSAVIHHLSSTTRQLSASFKTGQINQNQVRFLQKWAKEVQELNQVRLIAFYLPQFHPIPENDWWWGKGFTEWTNVTKSVAQYENQDQPRYPADLGYYDLRTPETMKHQASLARRYGISGFCFYYYWFDGHRLLEKPLEMQLTKDSPQFPFCVCWANENWSRRWDGSEQEILIAQNHSDRDDEAVINDIIRYIKSPYYMRINGKPVILIYRIGLFPDIKRTVEIWRRNCRDQGVGEVYLCFAESFEHATNMDDPKKFGFDASVEFPPHHMDAKADPKDFKPVIGFSGAVHDYVKAILKYVAKPIPAFTRFRSVMVGWDNTPRRKQNSTSFIRSSPAAYEAWLKQTLLDTKEQNSGDERIVFINAWNEWAEGTYLEPDRKHGHAYLQATQNALEADLILEK